MLRGKIRSLARSNAVAEPGITARIPPDEIAALCSLDHHLRWVDGTFRKLGLA